jgi:hypothetical protein
VFSKPFRHVQISAAILVLGIAHSTANAALASHDGMLTDSVNGLDWLTVQPIDVANQWDLLQQKYLDTGWRLATNDNFQSLMLTNVGTPDRALCTGDCLPSYSEHRHYYRYEYTDPTKFAAAEAVIFALASSDHISAITNGYGPGWTPTGNLVYMTHVNASTNNGSASFSLCYSDTANNCTFKMDLYDHFQSQTNYNVRSTVLLVRDIAPVPEPESWALLLSGLGLLGAVVKKKKLSASS